MKIKSYYLTNATQVLLTKIPPKTRILPAIDSSKQLKKPFKDTIVLKPIYKETWTYHIVKYGETAYRISAKYSISPNDLKQWNNLRGYYIYPGQKLKVGKVTEVFQPILQIDNTKTKDSSVNNKIRTTEKSNNSISAPVTHETNKSVIINPVFPKENIGTVTNKEAESPIETNNSKTNPASPNLSAQSNPKYHKVQSSETLYSISQKYGVSVDQIKRLNRLPNNNIAVGRLLRIW